MRSCFANKFAGAEWARYEKCMSAPDADDEICGNEYEAVRAAFFSQVRSLSPLSSPVLYCSSKHANIIGGAGFVSRAEIFAH